MLDCTLRDGGYCNQWNFGYDNIKRILSGLYESDIDIIECGFLTNKDYYDKDITKFTSVEEIADMLPLERKNSLFVAMMNFGEYDINELPDYDGSSIDGIRVAFHKKDCSEALKLCKKIKEKGYKVFIQAMVSLSYSDEEFLDLISRTNEIEPYAFYIVDSFGMMKKKNLIRLFYMVEHNLKENIWIGFHSHNNMQLAYSNAQSLVDVQTNRNLIIDASVYGMGRGAGNLNTELFVEYLNENTGTSYLLKPLLAIIDEILNEFYQRNSWGYSLPNYLSAVNNIHPNYASYLDDKKTLTVENMNEIFTMMSDDKRYVFDKTYIEELYIDFMTKGTDDTKCLNELREKLKGKRILLIAPGKSSSVERDKIVNFSFQEDVVTISVNFDYIYTRTDYIFLSNLRRFRELDSSLRKKCIVTSNINTDDVFLKAKYLDLLNDEETVRDNAGLLAIRFFMDFDVKSIHLAGFDGYSHDVNSNYAENNLSFISKCAVLDAMNKGMKKILRKYEKKVDMDFITKTKYLEFQEEK